MHELLRGRIFYHWGDSGGGELGPQYYKTEDQAVKAGIKHPVYVPEGAIFNVNGEQMTHTDRERLGRRISKINGLPLTPVLNLPDPDR